MQSEGQDEEVHEVEKSPWKTRLVIDVVVVVERGSCDGGMKWVIRMIEGKNDDLGTRR